MDKKGKYELILKAGRDIIESQAIEGFAIRIEAIFDEQANLEELQRILALAQN